MPNCLASEPLRNVLPIFHQAAGQIADPQVRNRGTIGGSLANADPAADWPAVVVALKGELELAGPEGRRRVAAEDFFVDIMTTALEPGEVLVAVHLPRPDPATQFRYRKIRHPASGYAVVGVAVALRLHDSVVAEASIGITGATGRAFAADAASAHLIGKPLTLENITSAAQLASEQAECLSDHYASADYRKHLVRTEVSRALASLELPDPPRQGHRSEDGDPIAGERAVEERANWPAVEAAVAKMAEPFGLMVLAKIDQGRITSLSGKSKMCSLYNQIIEIDLRGSFYVPFRVAVHDDGGPNGGTISYDRPSSFLAALTRPELDAIGNHSTKSSIA